MKYLTVDTNGSIGFKDDIINEILPTDVPISDGVYNQFFELQSQGKQFKILNINGTTFDEIFEELPPQRPLPVELNEWQQRIINLENLKLQQEGLI